MSSDRPKQRVKTKVKVKKRKEKPIEIPSDLLDPPSNRENSKSLPQDENSANIEKRHIHVHEVDMKSNTEKEAARLERLKYLESQTWDSLSKLERVQLLRIRNGEDDWDVDLSQLPASCPGSNRGGPKSASGGPEDMPEISTDKEWGIPFERRSKTHDSRSALPQHQQNVQQIQRTSQQQMPQCQQVMQQVPQSVGSLQRMSQHQQNAQQIQRTSQQQMPQCQQVMQQAPQNVGSLQRMSQHQQNVQQIQRTSQQQMPQCQQVMQQAPQNVGSFQRMSQHQQNVQQIQRTSQQQMPQCQQVMQQAPQSVGSFQRMSQHQQNVQQIQRTSQQQMPQCQQVMQQAPQSVGSLQRISQHQQNIQQIQRTSQQQMPQCQQVMQQAPQSIPSLQRMSQHQQNVQQIQRTSQQQMPQCQQLVQQAPQCVESLSGMSQYQQNTQNMLPPQCTQEPPQYIQTPCMQIAPVAPGKPADDLDGGNQIRRPPLVETDPFDRSSSTIYEMKPEIDSEERYSTSYIQLKKEELQKLESNAYQPLLSGYYNMDGPGSTCRQNVVGAEKNSEEAFNDMINAAKAITTERRRSTQGERLSLPPPNEVIETLTELSEEPDSTNGEHDAMPGVWNELEKVDEPAYTTTAENVASIHSQVLSSHGSQHGNSPPPPPPNQLPAGNDHLTEDLIDHMIEDLQVERHSQQQMSAAGYTLGPDQFTAQQLPGEVSYHSQSASAYDNRGIGRVEMENIPGTPSQALSQLNDSQSQAQATINPDFIKQQISQDGNDSDYDYDYED